MVKTLLSVLILSYTIVDLTAQDAILDSTRRGVNLGHAVTMSVGVRWVHLEEVNTALQAIDCPALSTAPLVVELGRSVIYKRFQFGSIGKFMVYRQTQNHQFLSSGHGFGFESRVSYNVTSSKNSTLYPLIGLAGQFTKYSFRYNDRIPIGSAVGYISNTVNSIKANEIFVSLGQGYDIVLTRNPNQNSGIMIGIQVAYNFLINSDWTVSERRAATKSHTGGLEIRMVFSGVRFPSRKKLVMN